MRHFLLIAFLLTGFSHFLQTFGTQTEGCYNDIDNASRNAEEVIVLDLRGQN